MNLSLLSLVPTDIEGTSSDQAKSVPLSIAARSLVNPKKIFYAETRLTTPTQFASIESPGAKGPNDPGALAVAGFSETDILIPSKPTVSEGLEEYFLWMSRQVNGQVVIAQGGYDLAVIERNSRELGVEFPKRFHAGLDLRSVIPALILAGILEGNIPLSPIGTNNLNFNMALELAGINSQVETTNHNSLVDATLTAQIVYKIFTGELYFKDLDAEIERVVAAVETYRAQLKAGTISGRSAILRTLA